jgi:hypothetical protein
VATAVDVEHNTAYQTSWSGGEMWQFYDYAGGSINTSTFAFNTAIAAYPPGVSGTFEQGSQMGYLIHGGYNPTYGSANPGTAHDNYFDPTTSWGPFYGGSFWLDRPTTRHGYWQHRQCRHRSYAAAPAPTSTE